MDNVLEYLASSNTSGPLTSNSLLSDPNDKNGLINVTSDKIKAQVLSTTTLKVSFLALKHITHTFDPKTGCKLPLGQKYS